MEQNNPNSAVKDRIVQTALKMTIEPIFEVQFRPGSYGFRSGRSCKDALRELDRLLKEGFTHCGGYGKAILEAG